MAKHVCFLENGSIYTADGRIIEEPAILLDENTGTVHGWGEYEHMHEKYIKMYARLYDAGLVDMASNLMCIRMGSQNTYRETQCYIIRRCVEYSASRSPVEMCRRIQESGFMGWLYSEMAKVPIDLAEQ